MKKEGEILRKMLKLVEGSEIIPLPLKNLRITPKAEKEYNQIVAQRESFAFKTLILIVISVRTKDSVTFQAIENIWDKFDTPEKLETCINQY